jgi:hypothetical protein
MGFTSELAIDIVVAPNVEQNDQKIKLRMLLVCYRVSTSLAA